MSRLKLKNTTTIRSIGSSLLTISKVVYRDPETPFNAASAESLEDDFTNLFEGDVRIDRQTNNIQEPEMKKGTLLRFHYDRSYDVDGEILNVVNIVVPNLNGKVLRESVERFTTQDTLKDPKEFDLDDFAAEALGLITILSCGD